MQPLYVPCGFALVRKLLQTHPNFFGLKKFTLSLDFSVADFSRRKRLHNGGKDFEISKSPLFPLMNGDLSVSRVYASLKFNSETQLKQKSSMAIWPSSYRAQSHNTSILSVTLMRMGSLG